VKKKIIKIKKKELKGKWKKKGEAGGPGDRKEDRKTTKEDKMAKANFNDREKKKKKEEKKEETQENKARDPADISRGTIHLHLNAIQ